MNVPMREVHAVARPVVETLLRAKAGAPREVGLACASLLMRKLARSTGMARAYPEARVWCDALIEHDVAHVHALRVRYRCRLAAGDPLAAEDFRASIERHPHVVQPGWWGNESMGFVSLEEEEAYALALGADAHRRRAAHATDAARADLLRVADEMSARGAAVIADAVASAERGGRWAALTDCVEAFAEIHTVRARVLAARGESAAALVSLRTAAAILEGVQGEGAADHLAGEIARLEA
jgi:hypothetical protein